MWIDHIKYNARKLFLFPTFTHLIAILDNIGAVKLKEFCSVFLGPVSHLVLSVLQVVTQNYKNQM